jgi:hypothetical protein
MKSSTVVCAFFLSLVKISANRRVARVYDFSHTSPVLINVIAIDMCYVSSAQKTASGTRSAGLVAVADVLYGKGLAL